MLMVLLSCIFLLFSNFMVFLLLSFLIMIHFSLILFGNNSFLILVLSRSFLPLFIHKLMAKWNVECINQCVEQYLQNFCSYQQDDWVEWISLAEFQYNNLIHGATCTSPFYTN